MKRASSIIPIRSVHPIVALIYALTCHACTSTESTQISELDLRHRSALLTTELGGVSRVVTLSNEWIAFVEPYDYRLTLIDPSNGEIRHVGRLGDGPGEFRSPLPVLKLRGDTLGVLDTRQLRLQVFDHSGEFIRAFQLPPAPLDTYWISSLVSAFADSAGWIYVTGTAPLSSHLVPGQSTPMTIARFKPGDREVDSVWAYPLMPFYWFPISGGEMLSAQPFVAPNIVGVTPDGTIIQVLGEEQRIRVREPNGRNWQGAPWGRPVSNVTHEDRYRYTSKYQQMPPYAGARFTFPNEKGLFDNAFIAPNRHIWLRLFSSDKGATRYLVLGSKGESMHEVLLKPDATVVGVYADRVFFTQETNDGASLWQARLEGPLDVTPSHAEIRAR